LKARATTDTEDPGVNVDNADDAAAVVAEGDCKNNSIDVADVVDTIDAKDVEDAVVAKVNDYDSGPSKTPSKMEEDGGTNTTRVAANTAGDGAMPPGAKSKSQVPSAMANGAILATSIVVTGGNEANVYKKRPRYP